MIGEVPADAQAHHLLDGLVDLGDRIVAVVVLELDIEDGAEAVEEEAASVVGDGDGGVLDGAQRLGRGEARRRRAVGSGHRVIVVGGPG